MPANQAPKIKGKDLAISENSNLAVLFDADNTSRDYVKAILDACARYGRVIIKRAYGDWTSPHLKGWASVFGELAIRPIQQFRFTIGKNITDSAMIIDAMDILHSKDVDLFVLVSSDSDFTSLANRIREEGLRVIGVGRRITPQAFVNACDVFIVLENLITEIPPDEAADQSAKKESPKQTKTQLSKEQGQELLIRGIKAAQDENGLVNGSFLAQTLRRVDPAFDPKSYGVSKFAQFLALYPEVIEIVNQKTGTAPKYKSKL